MALRTAIAVPLALAAAAAAHAQVITYQLDATWQALPGSYLGGSGTLASGDFAFDLANSQISNISTALTINPAGPDVFSYSPPIGANPASMVLSTPPCATSFCSSSLSFDLSAPLGTSGTLALSNVAYDAPVPNVTDEIPCGDLALCGGSILEVSSSGASAAPEIDPASSTAGLTLLLGLLAIARATRWRTPSEPGLTHWRWGWDSNPRKA